MKKNCRGSSNKKNKAIHAINTNKRTVKDYCTLEQKKKIIWSIKTRAEMCVLSTGSSKVSAMCCPLHHVENNQQNVSSHDMPCWS